ncbi:unnamed protein product, partial [Pylaiella littoralis]
ATGGRYRRLDERHPVHCARARVVRQAQDLGRTIRLCEGGLLLELSQAPPRGYRERVTRP